MVGDLRAGAAAAGVAEEREVCSRFESGRTVEHRELAELDEVIAGAARAELGPGAVLHPRGHVCHVPVGVHDLVLTASLKRRAHPEARLALDRAREPVLAGGERAHRQVEHGQLHAARDIDPDGVRNHRVPGGEHAADGEPVADVRIRHEGARHGDGQLARALELIDRGRLEVRAPDPVGCIWQGRWIV
jgi:hypothetical protein